MERTVLNIIKSLCLLVVTIFIIGCTTNQSTMKQPNSLSKTSSISVANSDITLKPGNSFKWRRDIIWIEGENLPDSVRNVDRNALSRLIEQQMTSKGYRIVAGQQESDYEIIAAVILGDSEQGKAIEELARLYPELGGNTVNLEKGTLMFGIAYPGSRRLLWRSAIQAFIADDIALADQQKRLQQIVASLLSNLPD
ncbi:MAG: hypothetical protein ACI9IA_000938 [Enterobacterales bacterium]|jgi:hypothetical protein